MISKGSLIYSSLAQSVEHLTVNQVVAGSSPAGGAKTKPPNRVVFCFGFLSLISDQRQSRATGSSNAVRTDGENAVLLAKFGRSDRKQFSSTWLACKTSLLIQVVAGSATRRSALRTPLASPRGRVVVRINDVEARC